MNVRSIVASGCSLPVSIPVSSRASRSAVATGPSSSGSDAPPGNAAWPAWWRNVEARTVSSRSASSGGESGGAPLVWPDGGPENNTSTAASRPSLRSEAVALAAVTMARTSAGRRRRKASGTSPTLSTNGRSQDGPSSGVKGIVPRASLRSPPLGRGVPPALTGPSFVRRRRARPDARSPHRSAARILAVRHRV